MVALHGLKGYGGRWREIAGLLPEFRVCAPDLRGHGWSPFEPPWSLTRHVRDIVAVLDDLGLERVDFVGHSFGGRSRSIWRASSPIGSGT
jgi:lipase